MKKSVELLRAKNALKKEIENLKNEGKIKEAHEKLEELERISNEFDIQVTLEEEEVQNTETMTAVNDISKVNPNVVFNKQLNKMPLTNNEKTYVENKISEVGQVEHIDERGGVLVPEEQATEIDELKRKRVSLKEFVNVIKVNSFKGKRPIAKDSKGELIPFDELSELTEVDIKFANRGWEVKDYGVLIPVSNTFLQDVKANIFEFINKDFAKRAVNTENKKILEVITEITKNKKVTGKGLDDLKKAINVTLDPAIAQNAKIFTNQSGFNYLDTLKDTQGNYVLEKIVGNEARKALNGKEIIVLPDEVLASGTKGALPFYVGDLEEAVEFYDRGVYEVSKSEEAGFTKNATYLKCIERFDVQKFDEEALILVEITPTGVAG